MATLKNVELFRTGTHTDSSGHTRTWTGADLQQMVDQYDPGQEEAPAVIGHPKGSAPAYGWVKKLWVSGEILKGDFDQVPLKFAQAVKAGRYKKRSISVDDDLRLQHVAFLGAALPAVSGLKDIEFSGSTETLSYEFTATNEGEMPEEDSMTLEQAMVEIERLKEELKKLKDEDKEAEFKKKLQAAEDKAKAATDELAAFQKQRGEEKLINRIDSLVTSGKLTPGEKDKVLNFAKAMSDGEATMDFSKGDGQSEKVSPREAYLRDLEASEPHGLLNEFSRAGGSTSDDVIDVSGITNKI